MCYSKVIKKIVINDQKICQINYFQNECCSISSRRSVMCEVNLVKVQCVTVKLLPIMSNNSEVNKYFS